MFGNTTRLFAVRGIDIRVDASWLIIAALVAWSFWSRLQVLYGHDVAVSVPLALLGATLFFASVLLHELAHALEAQRRGVEVGGITLFLFGGVTETRMEAERPGDEFALSAVGPWTSLVLACAFGLAVHAITTFASPLEPLADILGIVGWINIGLALFNLLPGAPLDGGRVLRSAVWKLTGDRQRAVRSASWAGQVLGALLMGLGLLQVLAVAGGGFSGLWLAAIGWFLYSAAKRERLFSELRERLDGRRLEQVATPSTRVIAIDATAADAEEALVRTDAESLAVHEDGELAGTISLDQVRAVAEANRHHVQVGELMTGVDQLETIDAEDPASAVVDLVRRDAPVVVTRDGQPAGVLSPGQARRALERISELGGPRRFGRRPSRRPSRTRRGDAWLPSEDHDAATTDHAPSGGR